MAASNYVQDGKSIDYTPSGAVTAGDVIVQGDLVGVALRSIAANTLGALAIEGVFDFPKSDDSDSAIAVGAKMYWDDSTDVATATAGGNKRLGTCIKAAAADDTTVRVKMIQG